MIEYVDGLAPELAARDGFDALDGNLILSGNGRRLGIGLRERCGGQLLVLDIVYVGPGLVDLTFQINEGWGGHGLGVRE